MPNCENCGSFVSKDFVRVLGVGGSVDVCVYCGPKVGGQRHRRRSLDRNA